jgi:hypothetical protein
MRIPWPRESGSWARRFLMACAALAASSALYFACAAPRALVAADPQVDSGLSVVWAGSDYAVHEPEGALVALHIVVRNAGDAATRPIAVRWSPEFAQVFTFMESDPPATNALIDGDGWGVAQLGGVPALEDLGVALWFRVGDNATAPPYDLFPRVQVLAEGGGEEGMRAAGERLAIPLHAPERLKLRGQFALDGSVVAQLLDYAPFVPATAQTAFGPALGFAVLLLLIMGAGVGATMQATTGQP